MPSLAELTHVAPSQRSTPAERLSDQLELTAVQILRNVQVERYAATCALLERFEQLVRQSVQS